MASFQPADNLRSRTFIGLLVAQFLAAFNDQAIHASAMFFAINQQTLSDKQAISLMPILFYAPWAIFCTMAGYFADHYSKRTSLVAWKVVEIGITGIALAGFWLGTHGNTVGPWIVLATVFLMGMHSAFFVPAKYGVMPEILQPHMLSRGNGLLESLSFLAIILGTVFGGVLSHEFRGQEYIIGAILLVLAIIGALASLLIERVPAADAKMPFPPGLYGPVLRNIRSLLRSRPLAFAVIGIAFFTFIVAFMRATVYMHGESQTPRWTETQTSVIVGMVALGIGIGSPLVGFLSGGKVELGLVPIGALGMMLAAGTAAVILANVPSLVTCIIGIGFFTGFYIVPLFTLLQHRAAKTSKGDAIATSNLINVTGAILASVLFFLLTKASVVLGVSPELKQDEIIPVGHLRSDPVYHEGRPVKVEIWRRTLKTEEEIEEPHVLEVTQDEGIESIGGRLKKGDRVTVTRYRLGAVTHYRLRPVGNPLSPVYDNSKLPQLLFLGAGLMTLGTLLVLKRRLPDLFLRTLVWIRARRRFALDVNGVNRLPESGPVLLATNATSPELCLQLLAATDRATRCVFVEHLDDAPLPAPLRLLARQSGVGWIYEKEPSRDLDDIVLTARRALESGQVVCLPIAAASPYLAGQQVFDHLTRPTEWPVLPVYCECRDEEAARRRLLVVFGEPLPPRTPLDDVRQAIERLGIRYDAHDGKTLGDSVAMVGSH